MRNTVIIVLLIALTGSLVANRNVADPQEGVRYVDVTRCLMESVEYRAAKEGLIGEFKKVEQQLQEQIDMLQKKFAELELKDPASDSFIQLKKQIRYAEEKLKFDQQMAQAQFAELDNELIARVLIQVNQACAIVGERNGYSGVFTKEMNLNVAFPDTATKIDILSKRSINWSNSAYDVTNQVVELMNSVSAKPQPQQQ